MSKWGIWRHYSHQNSFSVSWHRLLQASQPHWKDANSLLQALLPFVFGCRCKEANNNLSTGAITQPREYKCFEIPEAVVLRRRFTRQRQIWSKITKMIWNHNRILFITHSPAESEGEQLMSARRMMVFWHCWRKQKHDKKVTFTLLNRTIFKVNILNIKRW